MTALRNIIIMLLLLVIFFCHLFYFFTFPEGEMSYYILILLPNLLNHHDVRGIHRSTQYVLCLQRCAAMMKVQRIVLHLTLLLHDSSVSNWCSRYFCQLASKPMGYRQWKHVLTSHRMTCLFVWFCHSYRPLHFHLRHRGSVTCSAQNYTQAANLHPQVNT